MESTAAALVHQRKVVPFAHGLCVHAQQRFLPFADRWHNFHQRAAPGQEDRVGEFSVSTVDAAKMVRGAANGLKSDIMGPAYSAAAVGEHA